MNRSPSHRTAVFPGGIDAKAIAVGKTQHCDQYLRGMADFAQGLRDPAAS